MRIDKFLRAVTSHITEGLPKKWFRFSLKNYYESRNFISKNFHTEYFRVENSSQYYF